MSEPTNPITSNTATDRGVLPLRSLQLIGVVGTDDARRALLRTASGRIQTVQVGDTLRQGQVVAIDVDAVILSTGGETRRLTIPSASTPRVAA